MTSLQKIAGVLLMMIAGVAQTAWALTAQKNTSMPPKKLSVIMLLITAGVALAGCSMTPQKDTAIPWSRPASWEGQIPGMGQPTGR